MIGQMEGNPMTSHDDVKIPSPMVNRTAPRNRTSSFVGGFTYIWDRSGVFNIRRRRLMLVKKNKPWFDGFYQN